MSEQLAIPNRFHKRLNAMIKRSIDFQDNFSEDEPICKLLTKFVDFSKEYIKLLGQIPPEISRRPFVVNRGIERLLQEWNVLCRASEQRLIGGFGSELQDASKLAQAYCNQWNKNFADDSPHKLETPVVYFEKLFRISRSVYAPEIPVISLPLIDFDQKNNWQGLAHEFGHHIFWNGFGIEEISVAHQNLRNSIALNFSGSDSMPPVSRKARYSLPKAERIALWENWLEEVFADIYGTLLEGPAYAISSQDLMAERINRVDDFAVADREHPCTYLRPLISLQVLEEISGQTISDEGVLGKLRDRWLEFAQQAGELEYKDFSLTSLEKDIQPIVKIILDGKYWPADIQLENIVEISAESWSVNFDELIPVTAIEVSAGLLRSIEDVNLPKAFNKLKQHLKKSARQITQDVGSNRQERDEKLFAWSALLGLELSEPEGYHVHSCASDHDHIFTWFWSGHEHGELGTELREC